MRVAITSHRLHSAEDAAKAKAVMKGIVEDPQVDKVFFGGAKGLDTVCLAAALELRRGSRPQLVVLVPNRVEDQPYEARLVITRADQVVELGFPITIQDGWAAYRLRNTELVERADVLVALWDGKAKSGTAHAVGVANKLGRRMIHIQVSGGH